MLLLSADGRNRIASNLNLNTENVFNIPRSVVDCIDVKKKGVNLLKLRN